MAVTAQMVKELRERSGAGMMECKKALVEVSGDLEAAMEHLRKSGLAKADKKADRVAAEGRIALAQSDDRTHAVMIEVNSETDFVAKDDHFTGFAGQVADAALAADTDDVEQIKTLDIGGATVDDTRSALIAKLGENLQVRRAVGRKADDGVVGAYIHGGKIGVLVELEGGDEALARDIAMHVAALNPKYVNADAVPAEDLDKEREILVAQAADSGKPEDIIRKMVEGRLRKHIAEITLYGQPFVKDGDKTVEKLLAEANATVIGYDRLAVGEGIEKKEDNFADEVMAQVRGG